jgi:hypothetical protein
VALQEGVVLAHGQAVQLLVLLLAMPCALCVARL